MKTARIIMTTATITDDVASYQDKMNNSEAAAFLGISSTTLNIWRSKKTISIPYYKIGNRVYYTRTDLLTFVSGQRQMG